MAYVTNLASLKDQLEKIKRGYNQSDKEVSVIVGYTANYAIWVHEKQARHKPGKQWKFLEQPAREFQPQILKIIATALKNGATLLEALYLGGLRLQRESQKIVPIDTGNLKSSAFTAAEHELEQVLASSKEALQGRIEQQTERRRKNAEKRVKRREQAAIKKAKAKASAAKKRVQLRASKARAKVRAKAAKAKARAKARATKARAKARAKATAAKARAKARAAAKKARARVNKAKKKTSRAKKK